MKRNMTPLEQKQLEILARERERVDFFLSVANTESGRRIIEARQSDLELVRSAYRTIPLADPVQAALLLARFQGMERVLSQEVENLTAAEKVKKDLDIEVETLLNRKHEPDALSEQIVPKEVMDAAETE